MSPAGRPQGERAAAQHATSPASEPRPQRIGILGGSFDPVHVGHVALATAALESLRLDEVRWVPAGNPWQKSDRALAPAEHRAAMVRLAILGQPRFKFDDTELVRTGPSYMIDTVDVLHRRWPQAQLVLILGQDQYARLHTWHGWRELLSQVTIAVAERDGRIARASHELLGSWHRVELLPMPEVAVSSTEIRARAAAGQEIRTMVPPPVARYIELHHLYKGVPAG